MANLSRIAHQITQQYAWVKNSPAFTLAEQIDRFQKSVVSDSMLAVLADIEKNEKIRQAFEDSNIVQQYFNRKEQDERLNRSLREPDMGTMGVDANALAKSIAEQREKKRQEENVRHEELVAQIESSSSTGTWYSKIGCIALGIFRAGDMGTESGCCAGSAADRCRVIVFIGC